MAQQLSLPTKIYRSKDLRKGRYSQTGGIYLITFVTLQRRQLFFDLINARLVITSLMLSKGAETLSYVVMPDHVHWLMQIRPRRDLSAVVQTVKSASAKRLNRYIRRSGSVWQKGFHDHALRREENIISVARYIVANPLRAGLVKSLKDYSHWDAKWL